jgi:uncharacterized membrane protein YfcA
VTSPVPAAAPAFAGWRGTAIALAGATGGATAAWFAGGAFAGTTSAEVLKLLLGVILIGAAVKAFWRRGH